MKFNYEIKLLPIDKKIFLVSFKFLTMLGMNLVSVYVARNSIVFCRKQERRYNTDMSSGANNLYIFYPLIIRA